MSTTAQLSKLAELRAKTDRDLVSILDNALEVALLLTANERDVDPAGVLHRRAADIYAAAVMLVEKVEDVGERRRLEEKLRRFARAWNSGRLWRWVRGFESIKIKARTARNPDPARQRLILAISGGVLR